MKHPFLALITILFWAFTVHGQTSPPSTPLPSGDADTYVRPDKKERFDRYVKGMFGPAALGRTVATAGVSTWTNSPEEWGGKWEGFGKRLASNIGQNVIRGTVTYGLDEALKLDSGYYVAKGKPAGKRAANAFVSVVTARRTDGSRTIGVPRLAGVYSASVIARETWFPRRYSWRDGMRSGTYSLGFTAAYNLFREFVLRK